MPYCLRPPASRHRGWLLGTLLALSAPGWAGDARPDADADTKGGLFSVTKPAFGLVDGRLFAGEGTGSLNGTGSLRVVSQPGPDGAAPEPPVTCRGRFEHDLRSGKGTLTCDNGEMADFTFRFTGVTSGVGEGESRSHGPIRFTFGLDAEAATRALDLPAGTRILSLGDAANGPPTYRLEKASPAPSDSDRGGPVAPPPSSAARGPLSPPADP